ncbi:MAG: hypothetical protein RLZZ546_2774 [Bacteroidota bacterium]
MKKLLMTLLLLVVGLSSYGQLTISQSLTPTTGLKVGDTITVKYTLSKGQIIKNPRYLWFRYQYNNKALAYVSTAFNQGSSTQTYYTSWNGYKFIFNGGASDNDLNVQYGLSPWNYQQSSDWNVGQLTVQRTDASIDGVIATQKYILKDQNTYSNIFKLDLATGTDISGLNVGTIYGGGWSSITNVVGNTSQFKVRVLFPSTYTTITDHVVQLMKLKSDNSGDIDWSQQPIAVKPLDSSGEALFTTEVKVGDKIGVFVAPANQKSWMNDIVTVSDAYKAFLGISQTDISGTPTFFTYPALEKKVGLITLNKPAFSESDSYYMFAHVMGIDVSTNAFIPKSTSTSVRWYSGLLNQSWLDGTPKNNVTISQPIQAVDMVFAWGGDLDWSHSTSPAEITSRVASGQYANSVGFANRTIAPTTYQNQTLETANLGVVSKLEGGKVVLTTTLTKADLAGLQVIMNYDETKLTLDNVIFDAGATITNFSTHDNGRLTFGSLDQLKTSRIKVGTPYKLIFTPKTTLTNTAGLFYFVLSDAVDAKGNKINLIVE